MRAEYILATLGAFNDQHRQRIRCKRARERLAEGTWPQVVAVFGYRNPDVPRATKETFFELRRIYSEVECPNFVAFVSSVEFEESRHNTSMSFKLSMIRRGSSKSDLQDPLRSIWCLDVLVGTRSGAKTAVGWLKNFAESIPHLPPEGLQFMDKIFGEAVAQLSAPSQVTSYAEMARFALGIDEVLGGSVDNGTEQ